MLAYSHLAPPVLPFACRHITKRINTHLPFNLSQKSSFMICSGTLYFLLLIIISAYSTPPAALDPSSSSSSETTSTLPLFLAFRFEISTMSISFRMVRLRGYTGVSAELLFCVHWRDGESRMGRSTEYDGRVKTYHDLLHMIRTHPLSPRRR